MSLVFNIKPNDWIGVRQVIAKLDESLNPASSPTFSGLTLTGLTASRLLSTDADKLLTSVSNLASWIAGTENEIDITDDGDGTITVGIVNPLIVGKGGIGVATLTAHSLLLGQGTSAVTALGAATNGQLPIGSTGLDPVLATLTGTANEIVVTNGAGSITLSLGTSVGTIASLTPTDGNFIVGNGSTWITESGDTARTSLGLGTGDSPQFKTLSLIRTGTDGTITIFDGSGTTTGYTRLQLISKYTNWSLTGQEYNPGNLTLNCNASGSYLELFSFRARGGFYLRNDTAPTSSSSDYCIVYAEDFSGAGTTCLKIRNENDTIVRLNQDVASTASPTFAGLTVGSLAGILKGTAGVISGGAAHSDLASIDSNQHIDHTTVSVVAGTGMSGGGTIAANRTLDCTITQYTDALARTACIAASISDGDTTHSPDGNSVFDALALKSPIASPTFTGTVTLSSSTLIPNGGTIGQAAGPLLTFNDTSDCLGITGCNVAIGTTTTSIEKLEVVGNIVSKGTFWTTRTSAADNGWYSVTYGNGLFVAVTYTGTGNRVMTSPDGINWTIRTSAANNNWLSVTYGNGLFVAVAYSGTGNRVMTSPDGINWTIRTSAADNGWRSVTYGNGLFVAVAETGTGNRVMTSPDGINWTIRTSAANNNWLNVTYGNGLFVAVAETGTGNRVMTSPDGINWTIRTSAADNNWHSVTYGNGLFVAVAYSGTGNRVMTSPDGINWTIRTSAADNNWLSVTYGNGLFVAVASTGVGNRVMTSPDGINWTIRTSAADNGWRSVTYGNGLFVAVAETGTGNRVMTSGKTELFMVPTKNIYQGDLVVYSKIGIGVANPLENIHANDTVRADTAFNLNGTIGATGSITFGDTATVVGGIITNITGGTVTSKKQWASSVTLAATNGYGGAVADLAADQAYDYTNDVDLETNGYEGTHITVDFDGSGTTDYMIISVFGSLDGSNYDDIELFTTNTDASGADKQLSFIIKDIAHFRIGVKTSGTTNTFDYQIKYQAYNYVLS